ncbi:MAG: CHASE2 domain-containing protein [Acidobacteria bacterium]|nr:CHASE2 domain-containing protein [Acidobacteriota bacterium]
MKGLIGRYDILITVFFFLLAIPAEYSEVFSAFEDQTVSLRHTMRGGVELDQNIVFVSTDEEFFQAYAGFPLRRTDIGRIAKNISDLGAAVVAVDVLLDFPSSYGEDPEAAELLTTAGNVVLVSQAIVRDGSLAAAWNADGSPPLVAMTPPAEPGPGVPTSVAAAEEAHLVWRWMTRQGVQIVDASGALSLPTRPVPPLP